MKFLFVLLGLLSVTLAKPVDPCASTSECSSCIEQESCGFNPSTGACVSGDENGPLTGEVIEDWSFLDCPVEEDEDEEEEDFSEEDEEEEELVLEEEEGDEAELEARRHGKRLRNGKTGIILTGKVGKGRHGGRHARNKGLKTTIVVGKNGKGRHGGRHARNKTGVVVTGVTSAIVVGKNGNGRNGGRHARNKTGVVVTGAAVKSGGRHARRKAKQLTQNVGKGHNRTTGSTGSTGSTGATSTGSTGTTSTGSTGATGSTSPAFQTQPIFFSFLVITAVSVFASIL